MQFAEETAVVSDLDGDFVLLQTNNNGSCVNCVSNSGCGRVSSIFNYKPKNKLRINNSLDLKKGDLVIVAIAADKLLLASVLMYLAPLLLLFAGSIIAKLFLGESASIIAGLFGLFLGLLWVKYFTQKSENAEQFEAKLIRKIINVEAA